MLMQQYLKKQTKNGHSVGHPSQGQSSSSWGQWEQIKMNRWYLWVSEQLPESWPRNMIWSYIGSKLLRNQRFVWCYPQGCCQYDQGENWRDLKDIKYQKWFYWRRGNPGMQSEPAMWREVKLCAKYSLHCFVYNCNIRETDNKCSSESMVLAEFCPHCMCSFSRDSKLMAQFLLVWSKVSLFFSLNFWFSIEKILKI